MVRSNVVIVGGLHQLFNLIQFKQSDIIILWQSKKWLVSGASKQEWESDGQGPIFDFHVERDYLTKLDDET